MRIPNMNLIQLSYDSNNQDYSYFGNGLAKGECGIHLHRVDVRNEGEIECIMGHWELGKEEIALLNLVVGIEPTQPKFENFNLQTFYAGETFYDRCIVSHGRPAPNVTFDFQGEEIITGSEELYNQTDSITVFKSVTFNLTKSHHMRKLTCRADHFAYPEGYKEEIITLRVQYAPQHPPLDEVIQIFQNNSAIITMKIEANPKPVTYWVINDNLRLYEGDSISRYRSGKIRARPDVDHEWNATLEIQNYTMLDDIHQLFLVASNKLGHQIYEIKSKNTLPHEHTRWSTSTIILGIGFGYLAIWTALIITISIIKGWCRVTSLENIDAPTYESYQCACRNNAAPEVAEVNIPES